MEGKPRKRSSPSRNPAHFLRCLRAPVRTAYAHHDAVGGEANEGPSQVLVFEELLVPWVQGIGKERREGETKRVRRGEDEKGEREERERAHYDAVGGEQTKPVKFLFLKNYLSPRYLKEEGERGRAEEMKRGVSLSLSPPFLYIFLLLPLPSFSPSLFLIPFVGHNPSHGAEIQFLVRIGYVQMAQLVA
jgi:hypothetical protein